MNGFDRVKPLATQPFDSRRVQDPLLLNGGYRSDVPPDALGPSDSPYVEAIRFDKESIRKDYTTAVAASLAIPGGATSISVGFWYIGSSLSTRLYAVFDSGGVLTAKWKDGLLIDSATGAVPTTGFISSISTQGVLVVCCGGTSSPLQKVNASGAGGIIALSASAPSARFIFPFARRVIALGSNGNHQGYAFSADGDITDWTSQSSGEVLYAESSTAPLDMFQGGTPIGNGVAAVFRERSIDRMFETGNVDLAVGLVPWIDGEGSSYPTSMDTTPYGAIFLANDMLVTILTQGGEIIKVGRSIYSDVKAAVFAASPQYYPPGAYIPILDEYWISLGGTIYSIDLGEFFKSRKERWRVRTDLSFVAYGNPDRLASNQPPNLLACNGTSLYQLDFTTLSGTTGKWRSRPLNALIGGRIGTLTMLQLKYTAASATTVTVKSSKDGGATWTATKTVALASGTGWVNVPELETTGSALCFQIELDTAVLTHIHEFLPIIVERGSIEYA